MLHHGSTDLPLTTFEIVPLSILTPSKITGLTQALLYIIHVSDTCKKIVHITVLSNNACTYPGSVMNEYVPLKDIIFSSEIEKCSCVTSVVLLQTQKACNYSRYNKATDQASLFFVTPSISA